METSDDDFAWTDASSDSSIDKSIEMKQKISGRISDEGKHQNKKLNDLPDAGSPEQTQRGKKRKKQKNEDEIDFQIKSEPHSDSSQPTGYKRHKFNDSSFKSENEESWCEAEDYLNLRVKQEQATFLEPTVGKSKKKKKSKVEPETLENQELESTIYKNEIDIEESNTDRSSLVNGECAEIRQNDVSYSKKKKKKKKERLEKEDEETWQTSVDSNISIVDTTEVCHTSPFEETNDIVTIDNIDKFSHDIKNNSQIMSSTLVNNFTHDNAEKECNKDKQCNNASKLLTSVKSSRHSFVANEKKNCRISDRIRFEDDSVDYDLEEQASKNDISVLFKQFISTNDNLTPLQDNLKNNPCLSEDDDVWIVKGPHEICVEDFVNTNLLLDSKQKLKIHGNTYESIIDTNTCAIPILLSNKHKVFVKNMPLMGIINLHRRIPKVHIPYESMSTNNVNMFIALPDTKCRHPLFGINYKRVAKIPMKIAERLNMSDALLNTEYKKKKKHKIKAKHEIESDIEVKPKIDTLNCSKTKKHKHKINADVECSSNVDILHSSKNNIKQEIQVDEADMENTPDNEASHTIKKKKKIKKEKDNIESGFELNTESSQSKKKKKEIKSDIEMQQNTDMVFNKKKRKHSSEKESEGCSKKAKRVKHEPSSADAWESEQAIEKNLFDF